MALADELATLQSDIVVLYFKAHGYHWNVEGSDFAAYHELFETIYEDVYSSIDPIAENIRKLGKYSPFKLTTFSKQSTLKDTNVPTDSKSMAADLLTANEQVVTNLKAVFDSATKANEQGIANFIAERIDAHQKWSWQLRASTK